MAKVARRGHARGHLLLERRNRVSTGKSIRPNRSSRMPQSACDNAFLAGLAVCALPEPRRRIRSHTHVMLRPRCQPIAVVVTAAGVLVGGCGGYTRTCTAELRSSFLVTVVNRAGRPVCDASVTVRDGTFSATLQPFGGRRASPPPETQGGCDYTGPYDWKGTYSLEVHTENNSKSLLGLKVSADECHVITRRVTVRLDG